MQRNNLHSLCCLLRRICSRDFTSKILWQLWCRTVYQGMVRHAVGKSRSGFPGLRLVYGWLNMKNIMTVVFFSYSRVHWFIVAVLTNCTTGRKPHGSALTTCLRLKWQNYNYLWSSTFSLSCFFSVCVIKHIVDPLIGSSTMWPI